MRESKWDLILKMIRYDAQAIVDIKSGKTYAVELLLRDYDKVYNFYSIFNFFEEAYTNGVLYDISISLLQKALQAFSQSTFKQSKLFYNLDYRIVFMPNFSVPQIIDIVKQYNIDPKSIYFELSEKSTIQDIHAIQNATEYFLQGKINTVIDNFGTGLTGLQLLMYPKAPYIKFDRLFLNNIDKEPQKIILLKSLVTIAHLKNIKVIASCVENTEEYYVCKDVGIDLIQGFFIQKPKNNVKLIENQYNKIKELYKSDKREGLSNVIDKSKIEKIAPLSITATLDEIFSYLKNNNENNFVPIVDSTQQLVGVIYEKDIKKFSYSQFGMSLAKNANMDLKIKSMIKEVISAQITWSIDKILDIYNSSPLNKSGIFITKNNKYYGYLNLNNLLELSYKRNLQIAQDQNPLTKLPGNTLIEENIIQSLQEKSNDRKHLIYFDFNDFKPFNDYYGFRQGDRAILMFSEILKKNCNKENIFIGHIGGDDFFMKISKYDYEEVYKLVENIQKQFELEVSSLYNSKERDQGYIKTKDRFGELRKFSLLGVATAIIEINHNITKEAFDAILHIAKKTAKESKNPIGISLC
jgi:diguanylate cyclase (GGDEF)-like protein